MVMACMSWALNAQDPVADQGFVERFAAQL